MGIKYYLHNNGKKSYCFVNKFHVYNYKYFMHFVLIIIFKKLIYFLLSEDHSVYSKPWYVVLKPYLKLFLEKKRKKLNDLFQFNLACYSKLK